MFQKICILLAFVFLSGIVSEEDTYKKTYHENGELASEGWYKYNVKTGYWKYYHDNGSIASQGSYTANKKEKYWYFYNTNKVLNKEGHFKNGEKVNWWLFYDTKGIINHKCQLEKGVKNGYCLKYRNSKLTSAEKYNDGKKIKEWTTFRDFKRENSLTDLK